MTQTELENAINDAFLRLSSAHTLDERIAAWDEMQQLHRLRSQERVEEIEREQGLRH